MTDDLLYEILTATAARPAEAAQIVVDRLQMALGAEVVDVVSRKRQTDVVESVGQGWVTTKQDRFVVDLEWDAATQNGRETLIEISDDYMLAITREKSL
ncbi:MAG: hypothetical protein AAF125_16175, partial [Chloroflexota bacterium]